MVELSLAEPVWGRGFIDSGPAEYVKFTLERIELVGTFDGGASSAIIWDDPTGLEIKVSGTGAINLSGIPDIHDLPVGDVTGVNITINSHGKICGELLNAQFFNGLTIEHLYTKADYAYNAYTHNADGIDDGAADYSPFEVGPAEETDVYFNGGDNIQQIIATPVSYTLVAGATPTLTILVDLSRMLRFYNGLDPVQGPNPSDLNNRAYFFCHSLFGGGARPIACFFGEVGSIQGYQVICSVTNPAPDESPVDIPAWMTLIFNPAGDIQSGFLIGDDDNALTVAKGNITSATTKAGNKYDFCYDISGVTVTDFEKQTVLEGYSATDPTWVQTSPVRSGVSRFILKLQL
jgi:hypothetical protein